MHKAGLKSRKIAADLDVNDRTVRAIIKRFQERGTLTPKPIPGRPRNPDKVTVKVSSAAVVAGSEGGGVAGGVEGIEVDKGEDGVRAGAGPGVVSTMATAAVEMVITKAGKVVKKRGTRGPYKKRVKVQAQAPGSAPLPEPEEVPAFLFVVPRAMVPEAVVGAGVEGIEGDGSVITTIKTNVQ
ncbi:hypothetical protein BGX24_005802 [Mortierella sp. AD032]|nr:hypothetical protein BGX24_005802 [Mortierella sp. AD032]